MCIRSNNSNISVVGVGKGVFVVMKIVGRVEEWFEGVDEVVVFVDVLLVMRILIIDL